MGLQYRKSIRIAGPLHVNFSKSGLSFSLRSRGGSVSSRGNGSARLGRGFSYRFRNK